MNINVITAEIEIDLIDKAQQGDRNAFCDLVRYHQEGVVNVVYRMCGDANLAEDAAQDAFVQAWLKLPSYRPFSPFRNWLYRIAINTALDSLRRYKPIENVDDIQTISHDYQPEADIVLKERGEQVRRAVLDLPAASRAVIILREYEELSYQEIANTLDIPLGTVMSRLNYARKNLLESLSPYLEEV